MNAAIGVTIYAFGVNTRRRSTTLNNFFHRKMPNLFSRLILCLPLFVFCTTLPLAAQNSSKSKSKERFREKNERRFPIAQRSMTSVNTAINDAAPAFFENGVIFLSNRKRNAPVDEKTGEPYADYYFSPLDPNNELAPPEPFEFDQTKKSNFHQGAVSFSRDFKKGFFTRYNNKDGVKKAGKDGKSRQKIYQQDYDFPDWKKPIDLPFNSDDYNCLHPSISPDGDELYFSSDMPGGYGGFDLYVAKFSESGWGEPINLGPDINTGQNEVYPFFSLQRDLYFSSNGRDSTLGGYDIYRVNDPLKNMNTLEIVNLNAPINSPGDERSFIVDDEGKFGFYVSNRAGGIGKDDIYSFKSPKGLEGAGRPETNRAKIVVQDAKTGRVLPKASIFVLKPGDDGFESDKDSAFFSFDLLPIQDQKNALTMQLTRKDASDLGSPTHLTNAEGYAFHDLVRYKNYLILVSLEGYRTGEKLISVDTEENISLVFKMEESACIRAGGTITSQLLGTRIANAHFRFVHKETGYELPIRSTLNGQFDACLPYEGDYVVYVEREGFKPENFRITGAKKGQRLFNEVNMRPIDDVVSIEDAMPLSNGLIAGSVLVLDKVFYEYNKATLNQSATRHLDALYKLLKSYPEMKIELVSHTDVRGEAQMNQILTDERAKNAKIYLAHLGADPNQINAYGVGETEPRNHCKENVECSDEEHQHNNRIEIKIVTLGKN